MSCERVWLVVAVVTAYLGAGGLLFQALGPPPPPAPPYAAAVRRYTETCLNQLWIITERLNVLYERNWTRLVHHELRQLEIQVAGAVQAGLAEQEVHWSFFGSLLYSLSVITTIGCGNLGPKTTEGKLATMVYALVGVPLMLICFSHLGSTLAELIQSAYSLCTCSVRRKPNERLELEERRSMPRGLEVVGGGCGRAVCRLTSLESVLDYPSQKSMQQDSDDDDSPIRRNTAVTDTPSRVPLIWREEGDAGRRRNSLAPPILAVTLVVGYVCLGAWLWASWHRLSFLEGLYFTFSALTTIGLADAGRLPAKKQEIHLLFTCLFILVGLIVIATAFALVQEQVISKTRQLAVSLGVVKKEELSV